MFGKYLQPCHRNDYTWHLNFSEDFWANNGSEAGWHLIDFNGRWSGMAWDSQETELQKLGSQFARVDPHVFGEVVTSIFQSGNEERIAENWAHWSSQADSDGFLVWVGFFNAGGLSVYGSHRGSSSSNLRVCVVRKFDA